MKIKNLGPIKDLEIDLNKMNVFVGENGTGKTLAAYAIFAFISWFNHSFLTNLITEKNIREVLRKRSISAPVEKVKAEIAEQASDQFNSLKFEHFDGFFNHTGVYTRDSEIKATPEDVNALLKSGKEGRSWFYSWPLRKKQENTSTNALEDNEVKFKNNNRIFCGLKGDKIELSYHPLTSISDYDLEEQLIEFRNRGNSLRYINLCMQNVLFESYRDASPVYLPAERIGINVFRRELGITRLDRFPDVQSVDERQSQDNFGVDKLQREKGPMRYSLPIEKYISFVNNNVKNLNDINESVDSNELINKFVPGNFKYDENEDKLTYALPDRKVAPLDFEVISSSLKSIFGLDLFLKSSPVGKWLFFDEPEMNLHPEKQRLVAKLLYNMMKSNVRLVISTHSDYFIKELINCVLKDKINGEKNRRVNVYEFKNGSANKINNIFKVDEPVENFDAITRKINSDYYEITDQLEDEDSE